MVAIRGLDHFTKHFSEYKDDYVIVGGIASAILLENVGITFRATKDIDLVIITSESDSFSQALIDYIKQGGYQIAEKNEGKPRFYRFNKPSDDSFPVQLEIFHRKPEGIELFEGQQIVPISAPANEIGISAILLDDEYFKLIRDNIVEKDNIPTTSTLTTIVLKAKAFLDLRERKENGENIDAKQIKKHRSDVFRLVEGIVEGEKLELRSGPKEDIELFVQTMRSDSSLPDSYRGLNLNISLDDSLSTLTASLIE